MMLLGGSSILVPILCAPSATPNLLGLEGQVWELEFDSSSLTGSTPF